MLGAQILKRYLYLPWKLKIHFLVISKIILVPPSNFDIANMDNVLSSQKHKYMQWRNPRHWKNDSSMLTSSVLALSLFTSLTLESMHTEFLKDIFLQEGLPIIFVLK